MAMYEKETGGWEVLETTANRWAMSFKSYLWVFLVSFVIQLIVIKIVILNNQLLGWRGEFYSEFFGLYAEHFFNLPEKAEAIAPQILGEVIGNLIKYLVFTSPVLIGVMYFILDWAKGKSKKEFGSTEFVSGTNIIEEQEQIKISKKIPHTFKIGNIALPIESEASHLMIIGSSGAGKTQLLKPNINLALAQRNKCLINDIKGDWIAENFDKYRGDKIFNPMDKRSVKWTIFNDIEDIIDIENFSTWIIPENPKASDPFWNNSARAILKGILFYMFQRQSMNPELALTNAMLKEYVQKNSSELSKILKDAGFEEAGDYALKQDSLSTFRSYMTWVYYAADGDFSVKKWLKKEDKTSMFVSNVAKTQEILKPVLTLFINVVGSNLLAMPDYNGRKMYLFLDEFTSLTRLDKIIELLKLGRSKEVSIWLAFQDFQQLEKIYTKEDMPTFINNTATIAVMQLKEPRAAEFFAKRLGKQVFTERNKSISTGVNANRDGMSWQESRKEELAIKDSDILNMEKLTAYVKVDGVAGVTLTKIGITKLDKIANEFEQVELSREEQLSLVKGKSAAVAPAEFEKDEVMEDSYDSYEDDIFAVESENNQGL